MYISDNYKVTSKKVDSDIEYKLMEKMGEGRWKVVDTITTDKPLLAYSRFKGYAES